LRRGVQFCDGWVREDRAYMKTMSIVTRNA